MARSFDGVSRSTSLPTGPGGHASILLRRIAASRCSWSVAPVCGALLRWFLGLSEDQRVGLSATASILQAPVCARLAPDHCLMHSEVKRP